MEGSFRFRNFGGINITISHTKGSISMTPSQLSEQEHLSMIHAKLPVPKKAENQVDRLEEVNLATPTDVKKET